jgi:hypothetical protein
MALLSSAPSYITRLAPSPAKGSATCAASLDINQEYSRRPLHQRLLKSPNRFRHNVDIDPHKTTHDVLEFAFAEIACLSKRFGNVQPSTASPGLGRLFDWLRSRHLSKMHHRKSRSSILLQLLTYGTRHAYPDTAGTSILKFSNL